MTSEQYLSEILRIIRSHFRDWHQSDGLTVAKVGSLTLHSTRCEPAAFGFEKFSDALRILERAGHIRVGTNSKLALSIWLPNSGTRACDSQQPTSSTPAVVPVIPTTAAPFRKLKNQMWLAFIGEAPTGHRFANRRTGEIRVGLQLSPLPSEDWAEIIPINPDAERLEATRFLRDEGIDSDQSLVQTLLSPQWFREFSSVLASINPSLASKWKRGRSRRVIQKVQLWGHENGFPSEFLYQTPLIRIQPKSDDSPTVKPRTDTSLREILISAIQKMSTEELAEVRIPSRHLIATLRPDLIA